MPKFKPYNYDQSAMVVINYRDQAKHYRPQKAADWAAFIKSA